MISASKKYTTNDVKSLLTELESNCIGDRPIRPVQSLLPETITAAFVRSEYCTAEDERSKEIVKLLIIAIVNPSYGRHSRVNSVYGDLCTFRAPTLENLKCSWEPNVLSLKEYPKAVQIPACFVSIMSLTLIMTVMILKRKCEQIKELF